MTIAFFYFVFACVCGVLANTRGRNPAGWFVLALLISPILAGLFILALPKLTKERPPEAFQPDAVIAGTPYRLMPGGDVEAMTKGGLVRFQSVDQFRAAAQGLDFTTDDLPSSERFQDEVNGIPYRINSDGTVTAKTPIGLRSYSSWAAFRYAGKGCGSW
jgi:hypothetical protein